MLAKIIHIAAFLLICGSFKSYSMVSYALFQKEDKKVEANLLIFGETHVREGQKVTPEQEAWLAQNRTNVRAMMRMIGRCGKKVVLMVELHENIDEIRASLKTNLDEVPDAGGSINLSTFLECAKEKQLSPLVEVIYADKRQKEDFLVSGCLEVLTDLYSSVITRKRPEKDIKSVIGQLIQISQGIKVTKLGDYYRAIERNLDTVRSFLGSQYMPIEFVIANIQLMESAYKNLKVMLHEYPEQTILQVAIFSIFKDCVTAEELENKINAYKQNIHYALCVLVADISFMDQLYRLFDKGIKNIMIVLGDTHAINLNGWFSMTFKQIDLSSIKDIEKDDHQGLKQFSTGLQSAMSQFLSYYCSHCGKYDVKLKSCTGCRHAYYCDAQCQRGDWEKHKQDCRKKEPAK